MSELLKQFYNDEHLREEVKEFFFKAFDKYALEAVYRKEDTKHLAAAKEALERGFGELAERFMPPIQPRTINKAR